MSEKPLIVVESPTKVKTLKKFLGDAFNVAATVGHIKDLPSKEIGIDIENGFQPQYRVIPGKQKIISTLKHAAGDAEEIFLAPDPDREGEAIAWHTAEVLKKKGRRFHRVLFHELTHHGISEAMGAPQELNASKYDAQKARRILDRLVGYQISPLLWRKVKNGLSAGRVQSVAVRIICERERAIQAFVATEYWSITAHLEGDSPPPFTAKLARRGGEKIEIPDQRAADAVLAELAGHRPVVRKVAQKLTHRNPQPPFTTSKLQQDAIRRLRFSAKKTMVIAQQLYEGIELGSGEVTGLITYMRTDSTRIAQEAALEALDLIRQGFGSEYAIEAPRFFKNKKKVQDAHEAIRPASVFNTPERLKPYLNDEQMALYTLIWQRFLASQMAQARIHSNTVTIDIGPCEFSATGSTVQFPGFMVVYQAEDEKAEDEQKRKVLPPLDEGQTPDLRQLEPRQHFTQPPPRFTEASLVKELEENGIGRPSTYATILSTILEKGYVSRDKGQFKPSELGFIVNDLVVQNFPDILDVEFTARMEDLLDRIESAEKDALDVLREFYEPFEKELKNATDTMTSMKGIGVPTGLMCPKCNSPLFIKVGKNGPFVACSGYPDCDFSRDYTRDEKGQVQIIEPAGVNETEKRCEKCGKPMVVRRGRYGTFLACSGYPECTHTESASTDAGGQSTRVRCPREGCSGEILQRRSKRGKVFYGCSEYPKCDFASWDRPVPTPCPQCGALFLVEKTTKKEGTILSCINPDCGYTASPAGKAEE